MTELLVVPPDPEEAVVAYLVGLSVTGGPLEGWGVGTRTPENETPDKFVQVRQLEGDNPNVLLYRPGIRLRVWHKSEHTAKRYANLCAAYLRRGLGARLVATVVPLPDPVTPGLNFYQCVLQIPQIGVNP